MISAEFALSFVFFHLSVPARPGPKDPPNASDISFSFRPSEVRLFMFLGDRCLCWGVSSSSSEEESEFELDVYECGSSSFSGVPTGDGGLLSYGSILSSSSTFIS